MLKIIGLATLVALAACVGAHAEECNRFAVEIATTPVPYQHPHGLERTAAVLEKMPDRADRILIGDSLVEFWPPNVVAKQFKSDHIWNVGVGGGETQNTLWELQQIDSSKLKPSKLFILIGTNNLTHEFMPACAIADGVKAVVTAAHEKWPEAQIDVMGVAPRGEDFRFRDDVRKATNAEVRAWSASNGFVRFFEVDEAKMTCDQHGGNLEVADMGGLPVTPTQCMNYTDDDLHFRRGGYDVIFSTLMRSSTAQ